MTYEFLPGPEPGTPPVHLAPGFPDRVMKRIEDHLRQRRRRRRIAILVTVVVLMAIVASVYLLYAR